MKKVIKWAVISIIFILVLPAGLLARLFHRGLHTHLVYDFFSQSFSLVPGLPGTLVRACFYKQTLRESHMDLDIGFGSFISKADTKIGRGVLVTGHSTIGHAEVGDFAVIANYVSVLSGRYQHNFTDTSKSILAGSDAFSKVIIGAHAFVGEHCVVMANVGEYTIVGAGSVVVKDLPDYVVAVGSPAKVVKERPRSTAEHA